MMRLMLDANGIIQ